MKLIVGLLRFFRLPLQIVLGAYMSFVLIAITIAVANHHGVDQNIIGAEHEARPTLTKS